MGRPKGYRDPEGHCNRAEAHILVAYAKGCTTGDIALEVGVKAETVRRFLRARGVTHSNRNRRRERNPAWRGGRIQDRYGYWLVHSPAHPRANHQGYVREHRLVLEAQLGRYLTQTEVVDHMDGDPTNNAPGNLRLFACNADHLRATLAGRCPKWTPEGKERMRLAVTRSNVARGHQNKTGAPRCSE